MSKEKRRPTLEELRALPQDLWELEIHQMAEDYPRDKKLPEWFLDPHLFDNLTPEKVIEIRERLFGASGSTVTEAAS